MKHHLSLTACSAHERRQNIWIHTDM